MFRTITRDTYLVSQGLLVLVLAACSGDDPAGDDPLTAGALGAGTAGAAVDGQGEPNSTASAGGLGGQSDALGGAGAVADGGSGGAKAGEATSQPELGEVIAGSSIGGGDEMGGSAGLASVGGAGESTADSGDVAGSSFGGAPMSEAAAGEGGELAGGAAPLGGSGGVTPSDSGVGGAANAGGEGDGDLIPGALPTDGAGGSSSMTPEVGLRITDPVPGYAGVSGGTTGGGADLSAAIVVSSMSELQSAAGGASPAIILLEPGTYSGTLQPGANKTIVGLGPGVKIVGNIKISGEDRSNVVIRNLAVQGERCNTYDECKAGDDAVYIGNGAHHIWLDHLDISDGQDGNCDVTRGGDFVTISWSRFYYSYDKEHRYSNLIAGSDDEPESVGKLHITYMNCHWGERVDQRQPRGRFGNIHMMNNYHNTGGSQIHGVGKDMALIAENSVYDEGTSIWKDMGSPRGWRGVGNIGTGQGLNDSMGVVFEIPYAYTALPASEVVEAVTATDCGAGNRCEFLQ